MAISARRSAAFDKYSAITEAVAEMKHIYHNIFNDKFGINIFHSVVIIFIFSNAKFCAIKRLVIIIIIFSANKLIEQ